MDAPLPTGKLPPELLAGLLAADLPPEVRVGPRIGEDACAIDVPAGTLVAATDPITLTGSDVGAHAVVINANDVAVMGVRPRWFLAAILFPAGTRAAEVRALFARMRAALDELGAALVGGHTEVTEAVSQTVVVGQMLGMTETGRVVRTGGTRVGDLVVQVGPAPVEGAAVLAEALGPQLPGVAAEVVDAAAGAIRSPGISVVAPALHAAELGATALHDPTEGGLASGLHELAEASGVALHVADDDVIWYEPGLAVCRAVGADPWGTLASGALIAAFAPAEAGAAVQRFRVEGRSAAIIARATEGEGVYRSNGTALPRFDRDEVARVLAARSG